jgi:phosphoadenosine phosphosulfate reductase
MVDQFATPLRRKRSFWLRAGYERCMSTRVAVLKKATVLLLIFASAAFITGRRPWASSASDNTATGSRDEKATELLQALYELEIPSSEPELMALNEELSTLDPTFILQWAHHALIIPQHLRHEETYHPLVQVTSFGPTGLVILHMLSKLQLLKDVPAVTLDTLHLFKESYTFYDTIRQHPDFSLMDLTITVPIAEGHEFRKRDDFDENFPLLWKSDPKTYTKLTKQDPLEKVLNEWSVKMWITGRRRSQGGERADIQILDFEYNEDFNAGTGAEPFGSSNGRWKLNPIAFWTYEQVWSYIKEHKIPYNQLYDQGYTSIGDEMTTRLPDMTLQNNADYERSGRFVGLNQTECGLHSHRAKVNAKKEEAAAAGHKWMVPELRCDKCIDLTTESFEEFVKNGDPNSSILLEFFSPYCGGCQEFAPTMDRLAEHLSNRDSSTRVARFDITENDPPLVDEKKVFVVEATPTLYRVNYSPTFQAEVYSGEHDYFSIIKWLEKS